MVARSSPTGRAPVRRDAVVATVIATAMATTFTLLSSGPSLLVTFVPGVALAYALFWTTCWRQMPEPSRILPIYLIALAVQFLHFTEEYLTRFDIRFPGLWSAPAYPRDLFVGFNMGAYAAFTVGALILFYRVRAVAMVPLFFVAYGVIGNAIGHAAFCIGARGYFPGFWTSLAYWVLGPLLLKRLWETRRRTSGAGLAFSPVTTEQVDRSGET